MISVGLDLCFFELLDPLFLLSSILKLEAEWGETLLFLVGLLKGNSCILLNTWGTDLCLGGFDFDFGLEVAATYFENYKK